VVVGRVLEILSIIIAPMTQRDMARRSLEDTVLSVEHLTIWKSPFLPLLCVLDAENEAYFDSSHEIVCC